MMWSNGLTGLLFGFHLHLLFALFILVGVSFLIVWAVKMLDKKSLLSWALLLILIGIIGIFLTSGWGASGMRYMHGGDGAGFEEVSEYMNGK